MERRRLRKQQRGLEGTQSGSLPQAYELDDIKVEYHTHSKLPSIVHHFADFSRSCSSEGQVPCNNSPWEPFRTRLDFEVAEIALEAAMTKEQMNRLLDLVHRSASGTDKFTLQSHNKVRSLWEMASQRYTLCQKDVVSVEYDNETHEFEMHYCPLWDWVLDLLQDKQFVRFIDEPWTADAFWNAQSQLQPDAKPLVFILYADKNKLSTFGTAKGYPIVACIANLPVHIHNGNTTPGGGCVVGWLPIASCRGSKHTRKKSFVDFKNTVWYKSFYQLLKSIELDQTWRCLWPLILILSGDYEEHTDSQQVLHTVRAKCMEKEREEDLKVYSLRNVKNLFSKKFLADVNWALSIDRLHMNHEGLWEDHLWKELLFWISDLGWEAATKLDANFDVIPRWPNLMHFKAVMSVNFNDGSFHKDISKLVLFTAQDVLLELKSKIGYLLLRCIHYYLELGIYASFEVHTEETIVAGRATLVTFSELMDISFSDEYITASQPETNKNWNFPKKHMITHIFDNILAKGDVAPQILNYDHWILTSACMHTELDELDDYVQKATNDPETNEPLDIELAADPVVHVHLGSKQGQHSFSDIACAHETDRAFNDFRLKLNGFLDVFLPQNDIPLPDGRALHLRAEDEITEFRFLQVNYESMVDWRMHQDLLQCSPKFYGSPRFDCVIIKTTGKPFIAHLVYLFGCSIGNTHFPLALDVNLGLWHVHTKPQSSSEIILVWSIIRGAALAKDPETNGDYFVMHTVDTDMFLRVKSLQV
ncbi:uncharacterized protein F5147DRAFT_743848 [Suillus discolor]|uniref:Uncharacterized protein n=1 Tax=Suillus discolor TaxID=1912936 RepID=A0A9P7JXQ6_9AGAM|nr:uncharacterized protein F5147DRAFT_743848 [Suillus discolor]KAG2114673.1 hypothetical protein F5147DRAFT_743848 [Suillus discolor]